MSAKIIYKDQETKKRLDKARQTGKNVYINFDALAELPDEFEAIISEVVFNPKNLDESFAPVSDDSYMPQPQLMYDIAEARGIGGMKDKNGLPIPAQVEPIVEEVDLNRMLCKPIESAPLMRKMTIGRRVTKSSEVLQEDGTYRPSSACTVDFNVWERCTEMWSNEEKYSEGYTKDPGTWPDGKKKYWKYENRYKRKAHFDKLMLFANANAQTKAHEKSIRELACMPTGYKAADLAGGVLFFVKIRRSSSVLKLETAARLEAISRGALPDRSPQQALFGEIEAPKSEPVFSDAEVEDVFDEPGPFDQPPPKRERLMIVIRYYLEKSLIAPKEIDGVKKMIKWLEQTPDADSDLRYASWWTKAVENLRSIESTLPQEARAPQHGLY
jgi:hypothetical protein